MNPRLAGLTTAMLAPALVVGARGLTPGWAALPLGLVAAIPTFLWLRVRERRLQAPSVSRRTLVLACVLTLAAAIQLGR
ncbi:MAG: hypothetical protein M3541_20880, partial [Acidobacteriota bacterium]|nr:hypothetical protein [Acidobacteriota bacterium]